MTAQPNRSRNRWLIGILAVALAVRVILAIGVQYQLDHSWQRDFVIEGDANGYWELAGKIAAGETYSIYDPPRYVLRMPGYPTFLAFSMLLFGESHFAARLLSAVVGTIACGLVYSVSRSFFGETTSLLATTWAALSPTLAGFSVLLLSETLFAVALLLSLLALIHWQRISLRQRSNQPQVSKNDPRSNPYLWAVLTGTAIAAACYVRPSWILAAPCFIGVAFWMNRQQWKPTILASGCLLLAIVVTLLPWTIRNYSVTGHVVATTLWMGPSLYDGLNPDATGDSDMTFFEVDNVMQTMSEYEMNRHYRDKAFAFAMNDPLRTFELSVIKQWRYWNPLPNAEQFRNWPTMLLLAPLTLLMYLAAIYGIWRTGWNPMLLIVVIFPILYFAGLHSLFVSSLRYRLPAEYALLPLAAFGLLELIGRSEQQTQLTEECRVE